MLKRHQHKVTEAQSGAEFLQKMDRPLEALIEVCSQTEIAVAANATTATAASVGGQVSSAAAAVAAINIKASLKGIKEEADVESELNDRQLESHTHHETTTGSAAAELTAANVALLPIYWGESYDLVLMDNHMPKMTGPEATRYSTPNCKISRNIPRDLLLPSVPAAAAAAAAATTTAGNSTCHCFLFRVCDCYRHDADFD